jgi:hypothetical protein
MTGSGTCADVCRELGIPCLSRDIRQGFDATDSNCYRSLPAGATFDFVWAHPPYWRQKIYTNNPGDLSRTPTLTAFLQRYAAFIGNSAGVLSEGGKFAILMGDYCDREAGFVSLTYHTLCGAPHNVYNVVKSIMWCSTIRTPLQASNRMPFDAT